MLKHTIGLIAAVSLAACASGQPGAQPAAQPTQQKAAVAECTRCAVEVENRYDYQVFVFDARGATGVGEVTPLGKADAFKTVVVTTNGRPALGILSKKDEGLRLTAAGAAKCRQEANRTGSRVDYRYVCGR